MQMVVIGGTAAGLSAAAKARRLDRKMEIDVFEATSYVSYGSCGLPYFVGGCIAQPEELVSLTVEELREKRGIVAHTRHRVLAIDREGKAVKVLALGSGMTGWCWPPGLPLSCRPSLGRMVPASAPCVRWRTASG